MQKFRTDIVVKIFLWMVVTFGGLNLGGQHDFFMTKSFAAMGNFIIIGTTTSSYKDQQYVSFRDKNGREFKIPRKILSERQNEMLRDYPVVVFKEITPTDFKSYKSECEKYFMKLQHHATAFSTTAPDRSKASEADAHCL